MTDFHKCSIWAPPVTLLTSSWDSSSCQTRCSMPLVTVSNAAVILCLISSMLAGRGGTILVLSHNPRGKNRSEKGRVIMLVISPRSRDLSPSDFFLWGYVKELVLYLLFQLTLKKSNIELQLHWKLLPKACYSEFGTSLNTDSTCAESQAALILNIYENLSYRTNKYLNFSLKI